MTDRALENAQSRREALAAQINDTCQMIEEWRRELRRVEDFIRDWHAFANGVDLSTPDDDDRTLLPPPPPPKSEEDYEPQRKRPNRNSKKEDVAAMARLYIELMDAPASREELYNQLTREGLIIEGSDPLMVLSTMLWRMRDKAGLVRLKTGGYWLAERPYPAAGYDPATPDSLNNLEPDLQDLI